MTVYSWGPNTNCTNVWTDSNCWENGQVPPYQSSTPLNITISTNDPLTISFNDTGSALADIYIDTFTVQGPINFSTAWNTDTEFSFEIKNFTTYINGAAKAIDLTFSDNMCVGFWPDADTSTIALNGTITAGCLNVQPAVNGLFPSSPKTISFTQGSISIIQQVHNGGAIAISYAQVTGVFSLAPGTLIELDTGGSFGTTNICKCITTGIPCPSIGCEPNNPNDPECLNVYQC
jgi:hypothetical protein